ncbi:MAG: efflux transporter outer membrane subunit [Neisseriaceae bacterium]|nr:efflux transporter outer membrane subunit [Neisseriaceae bacterium]MBP6861790.1 efflux transporter outer membrane subunit [Neisseriaceae bacterium]
MKSIMTMAVVLALTGCSVMPTYHQPETPLPNSFNLDSSAGKDLGILMDDQWWQNFGDSSLNLLVTSALIYNQDLIAAQARVEEAAANAGIARSALFPSIDVNGNFSRQRTSQETTAPGQDLIGDVRTGNAQLSWELDLWGKLRAQNAAGKARFLSSQYNRDALKLSIAALVSTTYFQLQAADEQLNIAQSTLDTRQKTLELYQKRYRGGVISALELRQAEVEKASAEADVPRIAQLVRQTENALAVLVGRTPQQMVEGRIERARNSMSTPVALDLIPEALPSELLVRRADIRAAEESLKAANADIGVARAAFLPSIGLTTAIGSQSLSLDGLFNAPARTWSFVGNLAAPIFQAGRISYGVKAARAREQEMVATYRGAIQVAFRETLDALSAHGYTREQEIATDKQLTSVKAAVRLAQLRYDGGYSDYLTVLDAQRSMYQIEQSAVAVRLERLNSMVALYKALGGGWDEAKSELKPEPPKILVN